MYPIFLIIGNLPNLFSSKVRNRVGPTSSCLGMSECMVRARTKFCLIVKAVMKACVSQVWANP